MIKKLFAMFGIELESIEDQENQIAKDRDALRNYLYKCGEKK